MTCDPHPPPTLPATLRAELEGLFHRLDTEIASLGVACWGHGTCCDFERCEHKLFATEAEITYVREKHPGSFPGGSKLCPFWEAGACTERERRPLGCRTYFCDGRYRALLEELHEKYLRELSHLAQRHGLSRSYRLFVEALRREARSEQRPARLGEKSRRALP